MGVWDAMGEGISRAVAIWLGGREAQEQRRLAEEEKARQEREWLLRKMQGEAGMDQAAWERQWAQQQAQEVIAREGRQREEAIASQAREFAHEKELAGMRLAEGKEKEPVLYDKKGFNGEVALWLAMGNLGVKTDLELSQLLGSPQGQALAEGLVNRLASVHGWRYPDRNLSADFWAFLRVRNPNLRIPAAPTAAPVPGPTPSAPRPPVDLSGIPELIKQQPGVKAYMANIPMPENQPQIPWAKIANTLIGKGTVPETSQQIAPLVPQGPTPAEQAILDAYRGASPMLRLAMESEPARKQVLDRFRSLL